MKALASKAPGRRAPPSPWSDTSTIRQEIFGAERLEQHARSLAAAQRVTTRPVRVLPLHARLNDDAAVLLAAYRANAAELEDGRGAVPAAEWLLDNYHLVDEQVRQVRGDLPADYYRQLPKLADGPFAGYPRVFGLAWAFVAHTDSRFDPEMLRRFIAAYQEVAPLTIGELWAVAITLRIVLVENLRRLTDEITADQAALGDADALADRLFTSLSMRAALEADIAARSSAPLSDMFAARLAKRLRDQDPRTTPALGWLEERLSVEGATVDDVIQRVTHAQGAANVTVQNVITSMKLVSSVDWADLVESVSLVDERLRAASAFAAMDFETRNEYRNAIEELARGSSYSEIEVTDLVLGAADAAARDAGEAQGSERVADPGFHLVDDGRRPFERSIRFRVPRRLRLRRFVLRFGVGGYVGAILIVTVSLLTLASWALASVGIAAGLLALFALVAFVPATEVATAVVNLLVTRNVGTRTLPGLELASGVPPALRTLIVVPTMLTNEADLVEQVERLEVHHLAGAGGHVTFALLADRVDADTEVHEKDERLLAVADAAIARLNDRHGPGPDGARFLLLHRRRVFNPGEDAWMGWERKRGKLHELNRLLRGATDTTFASVAGATPQVPADVRYVITLDADTRLPRGTARRLVGKMAHPLNRPRFDANLQRVVAGYGILQPRVTPSLPVGIDGSQYQHAYSGPGGMDPYASAVSDVYQDLFGEGSYTGKGIYDVDAFEAALAGRIPENAMLSHDLFEGVFARAGLASDIEVVEDAPSRYDVAAGRQHRWTRGDWQLLPWLFGRGTALGTIPRLGRWKMLDNLRRSLVAPATFLSLTLCWLFPLRVGLVAAALVLATVALPAFLPILTSLAPRRPGVLLRSHVGRIAADLQLATLQTWFTVTFVADRAWRMVDAIARTLARLYLTRRHLLEWTTAAAAAGLPRPDLLGYYRQMAGSTVLVFVMAAAAVTLAPSSWPLVAPFALAWLTAPALAVWASRSKPVARLAVSEAEASDLRLVARRTWRYFETFVTPASNMLPLDNFQEDPAP
ncbi:MAG: protein ndvB, partial [Trueperaceae bacterium]